MKTWMLMPLIVLSISSGAWADAKSDFEAGNYAAAAKSLEQQLAAGSPTAEGYYNLGVCYDKAGETVPAVLSYERALRLDPGLKQARNALAVLAAAHNIPLPVHTWVDDVRAVAHAETLIALGTTMLWIGAFGLFFALQAGSRRGAWNALAVVALIVGGAVLAAGCLTDARIVEHRPALITSKDGADILSAPANNSNAVMTLPAGTQVSVLSPRGAWTYVNLASGAKGWVQTDRLTPVVPSESL